jgi:hypothetical protein
VEVHHNYVVPFTSHGKLHEVVGAKEINFLS